jgi:Holliday junction resolvase RusA-like endonuclease
MEYRLIIKGTLPNLNDYIGQLNINKFRGADMKRKAETVVKSFIGKQLRGVQIARPVTLSYLWVEPDRKRDLDNIASFGMKAIQDALVKHGTLQNDGWSCITGFSHSFSVDKDNPRIEVLITEV